MSNFFHAVVWVDHHEARVIHFDRQNIEQQVVHPHDPPRRVHHKAGSIGDGKSQDDMNFFADIVAAIGDIGAVIIAGPGSVKGELVGYIGRHSAALAGHIIAVETLDDSTDGELVAFARNRFRNDHQILPRSL